MKLIHCFAKGIFLGTYTSFWGGVTISVLVFLISIASYYVDSWNGWTYSFVEQELIIAYVAGALIMGILIPVVPLVVAGAIMACVYKETEKNKSRLTGVFLSSSALFISSLIFVYIINVNGNIFLWSLIYTLLFGLPYFLIFIWRTEKIVKLGD